MSHHLSLDFVKAKITSHFSHLTDSLLRSLVDYVYGMLILQHCGQTQIATLLGELFDEPFHNVRQRLRELTYGHEAKRGKHRSELAVSTCFAPLLKWVLSALSAQEKQVVLALDATYLGDRFVVLAVSVVVSQTAIPVAWHIQYGNTKGAWNPIWQRLLDHLQPAIPQGWTVYVLADSGLLSKTVFMRLKTYYKWVPMMRVEASHGLFRTQASTQWRPLKQIAWRGMPPRCVRGYCFKGDPIACTLICQWDAAYDSPCLILTSLAPASVCHAVYTIRYWIECGFKDFKRGLFHWEHTKMRCPKRVERLWLVMSIALLLLTTLGDTTPLLANVTRQQIGLSAPVFGRIRWLVCLLKNQPLPRQLFLPPYRFPT